MRLSYFLYFFSAFVFLSSRATPNDDLVKAVQTGNLNGVNSALKAGADVNFKNTFGMTPLFFAAAQGSEKIVVLLLKAGADTNIFNKGGSNITISESIKKLIREHEKQKAAEEEQREKQRKVESERSKAEAERKEAEEKQNMDDRFALMDLRRKLEPQYNQNKEIDNNKKIDLINEALKKVGPIAKPYLEKAIADPNNALSYIGEAQDKNYSILTGGRDPYSVKRRTNR